MNGEIPMFTGVVYKDNNGIVQSKSMSHSNMRSFIGSINPWNLLFAVNGDDQVKIDAIINALAQAAVEQLNNPFFVNQPNISPDTWYVYAYFDNSNPSWADCFYIGKGNKKRLTEHVRDALTFPPYKFTRKHHHIRAWLHKHGLISPSVTAAKNNAITGGLVRKLQLFNGPHAEAQAFYVEYFLITHIAGTYNVENATNGNRKNGDCTAIARSAGLDETNPNHVSVWGNTIDEFINDPYSKSIDNLWLPATRLLIAAPIEVTLTQQLGHLGLVPANMTVRGMGRALPPNLVMPKVNMAVRGAADATLTYQFINNRPYRIELKISATDLTAVINLRRLSGSATNDSFINYFNNVTLAHGLVNRALSDVSAQLINLYGPNQNINNLIKHPESDPYYKPFALNANGRNDISFSLADLTERSDGQTNWIVGQNFSLNLLEAIKLISQAFI